MDKIPKDYVGIKFGVKLPILGVTIKQLGTEDKTAAGGLKVAELQATGFDVQFQQRPSSDGIKLNATVGNITVFGTPTTTTEADRPKLLQSVQAKGVNYFNLEFETNPLDSTATKKIKLFFRPLDVIYDSVTIQKVLDAVALPPDVHFAQLVEINIELTEQSVRRFDEFKLLRFIG